MKTTRWLLPVALMALITPFTPWLDLALERIFYQMGAGNIEHFVSNAFVDGWYAWGLLPAQITVILAVGAYLFSFAFRNCQPLRPHALFLVLTLAIGGGFIVNTVLKDHWGRPRPKQVSGFGGYQTFKPYYQPNFFSQPEPSKSFPCGHCTMGFYFFAFVILGERLGKRWLTTLGWCLALVLGIGLGIARMAQGAHFLSDVLMTALIMWLIALSFEWIIYEVLEKP